MARVVTVIGTRPEIIKMAPVVAALDDLDHEHVLVHSGQHYDLMMDRVFFKELKLRDADVQFELRAQPPHEQVARTMQGVAKTAEGADLLVIQGDTNTTLAGALLGSKLGVPVAHVEAGIRSFDRTMPEEINRIVADQLSTLRFAPTELARENLRRENATEGVHVVGNTVVDALVQNIATAENRPSPLDRLGLRPRGYALLTFHRQENVDRKERLVEALKAFEGVARALDLSIVFPIHPRTAHRVREFGLEPVLDSIPGFKAVEPVGYLDLLVLQKQASLVLTDSGGLQEESCILRVPCVTLRQSTERPETLDIGANVLAGTDPPRVLAAARAQLDATREWENPYGDGTTSKKIAAIVEAFLG